MGWLKVASFFGVPRWIWVVGVAVILAAGVTIAIAVSNHKTDALVTVAEKSGETKAVVKGQETTLNQVSKANEATARVNNAGDPLKYDTCLRDSAPGYEGNCERYKPHKPLPH
jgi:hypothetical protein